MKFLITFLISFYIIGCGNEQDIKTQTTIDKTIKNNSIKTIDAKKSLPNDSAYQKVSFKTLNGFKILKKMEPLPYEVGVKADTEQEKNEHVNNQVPEDIKKLNGENIEITGYAFPMKIIKATATDLVLMSVVPSCCFGDNLKINDIIYVDASINKINIKENQYLRIKGKLSVEMKHTDDKAAKFLYWIKADEIELAKPGK